MWHCDWYFHYKMLIFLEKNIRNRINHIHLFFCPLISIHKCFNFDVGVWVFKLQMCHLKWVFNQVQSFHIYNLYHYHRKDQNLMFYRLTLNTWEMILLQATLFLLKGEIHRNPIRGKSPLQEWRLSPACLRQTAGTVSSPSTTETAGWTGLSLLDTDSSNVFRFDRISSFLVK